MIKRKWRHHISNIGHLRLLLLIIFLNAVVLVTHHVFLSGYCRNSPRRKNVKEEERTYTSWAKVYGIASATDFFDWEKEAKDLAKVVPVMDSVKPNISHHKQTNIPTAPLVNENSALKYVVQFFKRNKPTAMMESAHVVQAIEEGRIVGCQGLTLLDDTLSFPRLKQNSNEGVLQKGGLDLDAKRSHDVTTFTHRRFSDVTVPPAGWMKPVVGTGAPPNEADHKFLLASDELQKLIRMQGWPGIPRLYAACLMSRDGSDVIDVEDDNAYLTVNSVRYVVHRYEKEVTMCRTEVFDDNCDNLRDIYRMVTKHRTPGLAAIQLTMGFTKLFSHLWRNGVFPYKFRPNGFVITKDFDVILTSMESLVMFPQSLSGPGHFVRPLSDVSCRTFVDCPSPNWQAQEVLFRFGQHCKDIRAYCDDNNRCWGLDSGVYLCLFAKWIFMRLHAVVPPMWEHEPTLNKALACAAQASPEFRCSWNSFERTLQNILDQAIEKWG